MRDAADLDAGTVALQRFLQLAFDRTVVAAFIHIDEVDHDQAGKVAQSELAGDLDRRFRVGLARGVFDRMLARRAASSSRRSRPALRSG